MNAAQNALSAPAEVEPGRLRLRPSLEDVLGWMQAFFVTATGAGRPAGAPRGEIAEIRQKLFLTIREAACYSGLPEAAIRRLIAQDQLPAVKLGGWRIKRTYLEMLDLRHLRRLMEPAN